MTFSQFAAVYLICGTTYGIAMLLIDEGVRIEFFGKGYRRTLDDLVFSTLAWASVALLLWWYILPQDVADYIRKKRE